MSLGWARNRKPIATRPKVPKGEPQAGGFHWRMETARGPVHLWIPERYDAQMAGVVVYLHGYYTTIDEAWKEHRLPEQFTASGKNALFLAPEAPKGGNEEPFWDSLSALADTAMRFFASTGQIIPQVPNVTVMGHSGAYRTIVGWLGDPIRHIVLLDALYGYERDFAQWIDQAELTPDGEYDRQLTIVAWDTLRWSEPFVDLFADVVMVPRVPDRATAFDENDRRARIFYMWSQYGHMEIVTEGRTIPILLTRTSLTNVRRATRTR